jgi:hypothetical protein
MRPRSIAPRYYNDTDSAVPTFLPTLAGYGDVNGFAVNSSPTVNSIPLIGNNGLADPCPNFTNPVQVAAFPNASGFLCNVAGTYEIKFQATLSNQSTGITPQRIDLSAVLNDGFNIVSGSWSNVAFAGSGSPNAFQTFKISKVCLLAVGDIVDFRIVHTSTATFSAIETTYASFIRVQ